MTGTRKPVKTENLSAIAPNRRGMRAPPAMAVIINPESSLVLCGIFSTVIEKTRGNTLPNPKPVIMIQMKATTSVLITNNPNNPATDSKEVIIKNIFADSQFNIREPENLPASKPIKKNPVPRTPNVLVLIPASFSVSMLKPIFDNTSSMPNPKLDFKYSGRYELIHISDPTYKNIVITIIKTYLLESREKHDLNVAGTDS